MAPNLRLYTHAQSSPCRKVTITLNYMGLEYEEVFMDFKNGATRKPEFLKLNPQHTIPTLVELGPDGKEEFVVSESNAIITYLASKFDKTGKLLPMDDPRLLARVQELMYFDAVVLWPSFTDIFFPIAFGDAKSAPAPKLARLHEALGFLEHFVKTSATDFVSGTAEPSLADLALLATFSSMRAMIGRSPLMVGVAKLDSANRWADQMAGLVPNYAEANARGLDIFTKFFEEKTKHL